MGKHTLACLGDCNANADRGCMHEKFLFVKFVHVLTLMDFVRREVDLGEKKLKSNVEPMIGTPPDERRLPFRGNRDHL